MQSWLLTVHITLTLDTDLSTRYPPTLADRRVSCDYRQGESSNLVESSWRVTSSRDQVNDTPHQAKLTSHTPHPCSGARGGFLRTVVCLIVGIPLENCVDETALRRQLSDSGTHTYHLSRRIRGITEMLSRNEGSQGS